MLFVDVFVDHQERHVLTHTIPPRVSAGVKDQMRKPEGAVIVASHRPLPQEKPRYEVLDTAIERQFPNVRANTYLSTKGYCTSISMKDQDERLMPRTSTVVSAFIPGFMAFVRSY